MPNRPVDEQPATSARTSFPPSIAVWLWLALVSGGASVAYAQNAFPLSSLINPDVALYIEVPHPDRQWEAWERSELARRWKRSGLEALFARSDFVRNWNQVDQAVAHATPQTLTDHIRGLCAEGLSLAVFVPDRGPPEGLWISRARSAAVLESTLKAWDTIEPPLKTERRGAGKLEYHARRVRKGTTEQVLYFARRDAVLILSDHEQLVAAGVQRLVEITASPESRAQQSPPRSFLIEAEDVVTDSANAAVWAYGNPRAWDRLLDREFDHSPGARLARNVWLTLRGLGASLRFDDGITFTVTATLDQNRAHPGWSAAVDARDPSDPLKSPEQLSVLTAAPADAVLVTGGSLRPGWWLQQLHMLQSDREKDEWRRIQRVLRGALGGFDPWNDVGAAMFRDWGLYVTHRSASPRGSFRPQDWNVVTTHQLTSGSDQRPDLVAAMDDALGLGMQLLAAQANGNSQDDPVTPVRIREGQMVGRKMSGATAWDVGYHLAGNRLWVGWPMAEVQQRFVVPDSQAGRVTDLVPLCAREFPHPAFMAWVNLQLLRDALPVNETKPDPVEARLPEMLTQLVDRGFAAVSVAPQRVEFKAGGRFTAAP